MAPGLGWKVLLWILFWFGVTAAEVSIRGQWKENYGWEISCSWQTWLNDSLQSVRLYRNEQQYVVFRPEVNGLEFSAKLPSNELDMHIDCKLAAPNGRGTCVTKIELFQEPSEDIYKCEISGERPWFRLESKEYTVFVPPSSGVITQTKTDDIEPRNILNCSSTGIPAPKLAWVIDGLKVPADFTNTTWNSTTKLWHSWSTLNPQAEKVVAVCVPEVTAKRGLVKRGTPSEYSFKSSSCGVVGDTASEVSIRGQWKENYGWEISCSWQTWLNDSLQSVRLYRNERQYVVFRPEINGLQFSEAIPSSEFYMYIDCKLASPNGQRGTCVTKIELYQNATEDTYKCEISGERPCFRLNYKNYTVFVPPSNGEITQTKTEDTESRNILNCSSTGLPAPKLAWFIDGLRIPGDFTNTTWNSTTKLWHSWSTLNPQAEKVVAVCVPEVTAKRGLVERGRPIKYEFTSGSGVVGAKAVISVISLIVTLIR